ncbi:MAG: hypothetical protein V4593_08090 [Pseudomonadota bacterium]
MTAHHSQRQDLPAFTIFGRAVAHLRRISRSVAGVVLPYLDRYSFRPQGESGTNEWRAYVHHFLAPDDDGHHNHPFAWSLSIVLRGSYTEEVLHIGTKVTWTETRRVRWFNWITADKYHRIVSLHPARPGAAPGAGVWTLFLAGPLARDRAGTPRGWGFWLPGRGHVPWKQRNAELERAAETAAGQRSAADFLVAMVRARTPTN